MASRLTFLTALGSVTHLGSLFKGSQKTIGRSSKKARNSAAADRANGSESAKKNLHTHSTERRRTARVALAVPIIVEGHTEANEKFSVKTNTLAVCGYGGLITLDVPVVVGQTLLLTKEHQGQQTQCNIVSIYREDSRRVYVGIEFVDPTCNFWHMTFTAPGARPLRRVVPIRISA